MTQSPSGRAYTAEDTELMVAIGQRIRTRRLELGYQRPIDLTLKMADGDREEARRLADNLSPIELGRYYPKPPLLLRIAAALETSSSFILGDLDDDVTYQHGYRAALLDAAESIAALRRK
jgi:transcriptional regulator with XRE-family HTH domain